MKKVIIISILVAAGLIVGCGINPNLTETANASIPSNYKEEDLGRIKVITYIDEDNGNVVYISYDSAYAHGNRLEAIGMTSQPLNVNTLE